MVYDFQTGDKVRVNAYRGPEPVDKVLDRVGTINRIIVDSLFGEQFALIYFPFPPPTGWPEYVWTTPDEIELL